MHHYKTFIFESYTFDRKKGKISLKYSLDDSIHFEEILTLPRTSYIQAEEKLIEKALFNLHLIGGISYYKTFCPKNITVHSGSLTKNEAKFWNTLYTKGLGEFFYKNRKDFRNLIKFPFQKYKKATSIRHKDKKKILVPIGGGKDSIVTAELLKKYHLDFDCFILNDSSPQENTLKLLNKRKIFIKRELSPNLFELNKHGALNGHIPISAYIAFLTIVVSILYGYRYIILSNERSTEEENLEYFGTKINHQYSKSLEFESDFREYVRSSITPDIDYFSLLRPWSEFKITEIFSDFPKYFHQFSSCNRNFRIQKQNESFWCGKCPKCAFVFIMLSSFLKKEKVIEIFGKNLLNDEKLLSTYVSLLGQTSAKPFECVGTFDEVKFAFIKTSENKDFQNDSIIKYFVKKVLPRIKDGNTLLKKVLNTEEIHHIPKVFHKIIEGAKQEKFKEWKGKKIAMYGFGKEGKATLAVLKKYLPNTEIAIIDEDEKKKIKTKNIKIFLGPSSRKHLKNYDVIIKSPGIAENPELKKLKDRVTSLSQIFFDNLDESNMVIGITGSKGKSTVATLIYKIIFESNKKVRLVGNIGQPALKYFEEKNTIFVYELSSYQLANLKAHLNIVVFTSFFPEHMNYHGSLEKYFDAKASITKYQKPDDFFIFHAQDKKVREIKTKAKKISLGLKNSFWHDSKYFYEGNNKLFSVKKVKLLGNHNWSNILTVLATAKILNINKKTIESVVEGFNGLKHRLEYLGKFRGIHFYDDAISTTPESTIEAIKIFKKNLGTIFLGGQDRGYDFKNLAEILKTYEVENIVFFPDSGAKIKKAIKNIGFHPAILETKNMKEAVKFAYKKTKKEQVCLLSTASPSYSIFKNFEEKGRSFQKYVRQSGTRNDLT